MVTRNCKEKSEVCPHKEVWRHFGYVQQQTKKQSALQEALRPFSHLGGDIIKLQWDKYNEKRE